MGLSIAYLLLFNRGTRQSLHDLAVGAYVVSNNASSSGRESKEIWPAHSLAFFGKNHDTTTTHLFSSNIVLSKRVTDIDALANRMARIILDHDPSAGKEDVIAISISYGYDIGIASAWRSRNFDFSPEQWRKRLDVILPPR